jgi:hypothetical protein
MLDRCRSAHRGLDVAKDLAELLALARGEKCIKRCSDDITALLGFISQVPRERRPLIVASTMMPISRHTRMLRVKTSSPIGRIKPNTKTIKKSTIRMSFRGV